MYAYIALVIVILILLLWMQPLQGFYGEHFDYRWPMSSHSPHDILLRVLYARGSDMYETTVFYDATVLYKLKRGRMLKSWYNATPDPAKFFAAARITNFPFQKVSTCQDNPSDYTLMFDGKTIEIGCGTAELYDSIAELEA